MALRRDAFLKPLLQLHRGYRSTVFRGAVAAAADSHQGNQATNELMDLEEKFSAHKWVPYNSQCYQCTPLLWAPVFIAFAFNVLKVTMPKMNEDEELAAVPVSAFFEVFK